MSFTICRAHMVQYFLNGTVCPSLPRLCRKRRALRSSSSYQALLLLLLPWRHPPVSWGKRFNKPDNLIGRRRPDRFRLSGQHADRSARRAVPFGWRTADSGTAEDEAPLLRTDEAAAGFDWQVWLWIQAERLTRQLSFWIQSTWLTFFQLFSSSPRLGSDRPREHCLAQQHIHRVFNW